MLTSDSYLYSHYSDKPCPHCKHRRNAKVTILWMMHGEEGTVHVVMCDACAVRLARGILQDADDSMLRTNLLESDQPPDHQTPGRPLSSDGKPSA